MFTKKAWQRSVHPEHSPDPSVERTHNGGDVFALGQSLRRRCVPLASNVGDQEQPMNLQLRRIVSTENGVYQPLSVSLQIILLSGHLTTSGHLV